MLAITKAVKQVFVPHYRFKNLSNVPRNVGGLKKRKARQRGKQVDSELTSFALDPSKAKLCIETRLVLDALAERNMSIVDTQFAVQNAELGLRGVIDVLARDADSDVVLEIKRGCHYRECSTPGGTTRHQPEFVSDCPRHQHELQALLGLQLLNRPGARCALIYVDENKCEFIPQHQFRTRLTPDGLAAIKHAANLKARRQHKR